MNHVFNSDMHVCQHLIVRLDSPHSDITHPLKRMHETSENRDAFHIYFISVCKFCQFVLAINANFSSGGRPPPSHTLHHYSVNRKQVYIELLLTLFVQSIHIPPPPPITIFFFSRNQSKGSSNVSFPSLPPLPM